MLINLIDIKGRVFIRSSDTDVLVIVIGISDRLGDVILPGSNSLTYFLLSEKASISLAVVTNML